MVYILLDMMKYIDIHACSSHQSIILCTYCCDSVLLCLFNCRISPTTHSSAHTATALVQNKDHQHHHTCYNSIHIKVVVLDSAPLVLGPERNKMAVAHFVVVFNEICSSLHSARLFEDGIQLADGLTVGPSLYLLDAALKEVTGDVPCNMETHTQPLMLYTSTVSKLICSLRSSNNWHTSH